MKTKNKNIRKGNLTQLGLALIILILVNVIASFWFSRFDLTGEKRYTLSEPTQKILKNLDDIVYFEVYLDGDFPAGFKRLKRETREMLDQFRAYSDNIQYEFINPSQSKDGKEQNEVYRRLMERGLQPTDLQVKTADGSKQQIIFPGAMVSYKSKEMPMELLNSQIGVSPESVLNNSIQNLEFNLANTIWKLSVDIKPKVVFLEGHGELSGLEIADIAYALSEYYNVGTIKIDGQLNSLTERTAKDSVNAVIRNKYDALIIAKPDTIISEKDKFIIDQFIMRGGKVLWLIDPVFASMDSIQFSDATVGIINDVNLDDQFFTYGFRANTNLVMDINALPIPLKTGQMGGAPQIDFFPWYYFPVLNPVLSHPIVRNLNAIRTEFVSSIDTLSKKGTKKTILLTSSKYARTVTTPALISLDILQKDPDPRLYNKEYIPVAALLEGKFESAFKNRIPTEIRNDQSIGFVGESRPTKMIIVADGDMIKNQVNRTGEKPIPFPLGYDRYTGRTFGNKDFILNAMNHLIDESNLITIRSRDVKLRLLDKTKVNENKLFWQILNTVLPVVLIFVFGFIMFALRKRKYSR
ncbi:MAG: gliding motility-associated ABC transporter substrate-binding protein GldG [Bacteroidetes bacterium]|nr:MAG: gliding motility-associated ABC transporter substrate-binding protein GldG [Bacteroidota bacterium]